MSTKCDNASKTRKQSERAVGDVAFVLEADISSICCKGDVTYYTFDDFRDNNYLSCCRKAIIHHRVHVSTALTAQSSILFPKVVLAHIILVNVSTFYVHFC